MLLLQGEVFLCDMEPGDAHNVEMEALRGFVQEEDTCHDLKDRENIWPPEEKDLWPLALYLYALGNSTTSIRERMKRNNLKENEDDKRAADLTKSGQEPACPLAAALAVLRDRAAAIVLGNTTTALVHAIELLAAASWQDTEFWTFEEQLSHYLQSGGELQAELDKREKCVVGRLGVLFGYALSCHKSKQIKQET
eukprot:g76016.t1